MTLIELKAAAYDAVIQIETWNITLRKINEEISKRISEARSEPKQEEKTINATVSASEKL